MLRGRLFLVTSQESSWRTVHAAVSHPPQPESSPPALCPPRTSRDTPSKVSCCRPSAGRARGSHVWAFLCSILDLLVPVLPRLPRLCCPLQGPSRALGHAARPPHPVTAGGCPGDPPSHRSCSLGAAPPGLRLPVLGPRACEPLCSRRPLPPPGLWLLVWPLWPQLHTRWPQRE